jgi:hypothetical protein
MITHFAPTLAYRLAVEATLRFRPSPSQCGADRGELATREAAPREAHPVGNTGTTSHKLTQRHGEAIPAVFSGVAHG